ncbi:MAG: peptidogalycan biosysnthesis protein, partial [Pseudomonadota bacterium]
MGSADTDAARTDAAPITASDTSEPEQIPTKTTADNGPLSAEAEDKPTYVVRTISQLADLPAEHWDACANPPASPKNPFISHAFLTSLEVTGCITPRAGWQPMHITLSSSKDTPPLAVMPCYVKGHSQGEFVFDYAWADAFHRTGGDYYPKLLCAVPFSPVPGRRILTPPGPDADKHAKLLTAAALDIVRQNKISSLHVNFADETTWRTLGEAGFLLRTDQQFHFNNPGYDSFDDFLATLASRKRKAIRKERKAALSAGLDVEWLS